MRAFVVTLVEHRYARIPPGEFNKYEPMVKSANASARFSCSVYSAKASDQPSPIPPAPVVWRHRPVLTVHQYHNRIGEPTRRINKPSSRVNDRKHALLATYLSVKAS